MTRQQLVVGNWKMNTDRDSAVALARKMAALPAGGVTVVICPPFVWMEAVAATIAGSEILLGAQNCWPEAKGAFTGEVSAAMLTGVCSHVLVGHSERRAIFHESDELIARKLRAALDHGLRPILCVGEQLVQRQAGSEVATVAAQLRAGLSLLSSTELPTQVIAYEPVWAIGTGLAATADDATAMIAAIRSTLNEIALGSGDAAAVLYGGSVTAANAAELLGAPGIDGVLVGGASLSAETFETIVTAARH